MNIITLITKRSVREVLEERKFLKFYSSLVFSPGSMIEIIEGNKKTLAIIIKTSSAENFKQEIRSGNLEIKKLKLSKTGPNYFGRIINNYSIEEIKKKKIPNFFPKKRKTFQKNKTVSEKYNLQSINLEKYKNRERKYYNENQELVDTIRKHFQEQTVRGIASFSYYLGFFKKVPLSIIKQFFAEAQQSKKPIAIQKRIFWKKIGEYLRNKKR